MSYLRPINSDEFPFIPPNFFHPTVLQYIDHLGMVAICGEPGVYIKYIFLFAPLPPGGIAEKMITRLSKKGKDKGGKRERKRRKKGGKRQKRMEIGNKKEKNGFWLTQDNKQNLFGEKNLIFSLPQGERI